MSRDRFLHEFLRRPGFMYADDAPRFAMNFEHDLKPTAVKDEPESDAVIALRAARSKRHGELDRERREVEQTEARIDDLEGQIEDARKKLAFHQQYAANVEQAVAAIDAAIERVTDPAHN
jgi:chromosome segregation ATPase